MKNMPKPYRFAVTAFAFALFALGTLVLSLGLLIFIGLPPFPSGLKRRYTRRVIMFAARLHIGVLRAFGLLTIKFDGIENLHQASTHQASPNQASLNQRGILVIANHPTLLDAVLLMSVIPNITFIVKAAIASNPFTSTMVSMAGYIPNNEEGVALVEKAANAIARGETLVVFPEGTRSNAEVGLSFKRGAANIALQANCPIQPILIKCSPLTLRKHEKWYSVPDTTPFFQVTILPILGLKDYVDTTRPVGLQARELNHYLQNKFTHELELLK
jgi:1-acyl-sn-glycerol-3-phosphate acyltransferase